MGDDPRWPARKNTRWEGYDYRQAGVYFITICTAGRLPIFGEIGKGTKRLNELGRIVEEEWLRSAEIRREIALDDYVVMPNHIHGLLALIDQDAAGARGVRPPIVGRPAFNGPATGDGRRRRDTRLPESGRTPCAPTRPPRSVGSFVAGFKAATTRRINAHRASPGTPIWQRNYHDHVVRDDDALARIRHYIATNPQQWSADRYGPSDDDLW